MKISKHFDLRELVDQSTWVKHKANSKIFLDNRIIDVLEHLRERFGLVVINTWFNSKMAGKYDYREYSGYRSDDCEIGAKNSQHRYGRACDCLFPDADMTKVKEYIIQKKCPHITRIEGVVSWLHFDLCWTGIDDLVIFKAT